ncbi:MAG: MarR family transcriptional regulator [Oricola sp.]
MSDTCRSRAPAESSHANSGLNRDLFMANILGAFTMALNDKMNRAVSDAAGLNSSACYAVVTIGTEPGSTIEELRRMLDLEHSSAVRTVAKLEAKGIVTKSRRPCDDKRVVRINLTKTGEDLFSRILDARQEVLTKVTSRMTEEERQLLDGLIRKGMPDVVEPGDDQHYVCRLCDMEACDQTICPVNLAYPELTEIPDAPFRRPRPD